jgi:DNA invertase Pin-like site-specific DNA recombinase
MTPSTPVTPAPKFIGYVRVSTSQQADSGLGQEGQLAAIRLHVMRTEGQLLDVFSEVESGKKNHRPQLQLALAAARKRDATLVIARLDRLGRNVRFLAALMESDVPFLALDVPGMNKLTLHVLAAVAENELRDVSARTKAGLQAARMRGTKLGTPANLTLEAARKGARVQARRARERYPMEGALILEWRKQGLSYQSVANRLNAIGAAQLTTAWSPMKVKRVEGYARAPFVITRTQNSDAA